MTVSDASLDESGSNFAIVAATSLLLGVTRTSSDAHLLSALRLNVRKDSGHCRWRVNVHRLSSSGGAVSVSQSLSGLRSSQSQPHGCCQRSGYAAVEPTRPAKFVLGGFATSSAPAFPSSCAAATAAAAAVRGSEIDYRCATTIDKAYHLRISVLYYSCTIECIAIYELDTYLCQSLLSTAIPSIVDNETFFDSPLCGNFGPTSTTGSASPSLSSTHCGRER